MRLVGQRSLGIVSDVMLRSLFHRIGSSISFVKLAVLPALRLVQVIIHTSTYRTAFPTTSFVRIFAFSLVAAPSINVSFVLICPIPSSFEKRSYWQAFIVPGKLYSPGLLFVPCPHHECNILPHEGAPLYLGDHIPQHPLWQFCHANVLWHHSRSHQD